MVSASICPNQTSWDEPEQSTDSYEPEQSTDSYEPEQSTDSYKPEQTTDSWLYSLCAQLQFIR